MLVVDTLARILKVTKCAGHKTNIRGCVKIDNRLERHSALASNFPLAEFDQSWSLVLESSNDGDLLRYPFVGLLLSFLNSAEVVDIWLGGSSGNLNNFWRYGGGEKEGLPVDLRSGREQLLYCFYLRRKPLIKQSVCLIQNEGAEVRCADLTVGIGKNVIESARGSNEDVTSLVFNCP